MSQRGEHQESKKELERSPSETMKAEESYEEDKVPKSEDWRPPSVFGAADLKNSNQVLSTFCMHIFCL